MKRKRQGKRRCDGSAPEHILGGDAYQVEEHVTRGGVMRAIEEFRGLHLTVALSKEGKALWVEGANGLREVAERAQIVEV